MNNNNKFYSLNNILEYEATYNVIFGERSNGKTYAVLKEAIKQYFKDKGQLAIVRRWSEDIKPVKARSMFDALIANGEVERLSDGEYESIVFQNGKFFFCNFDSDHRPIYNDNDLFAHLFAIGGQEHYKSLSYPNVTNILFDEFLTKGATLPDEFTLFMNIVSTIVRQRDNVKVFMLGNTVNPYSPYFKEMGLTNVREMKQGSIDIYEYGETSELRVAVEYTKPNKQSKKSDKYFAFDNPKLRMITKGAWELDMFPHLPMKYTPKDIELIYFIEFEDRLFQAEIIVKNDNMFTFIHEKTTPIQDTNTDLVYTLEHSPKPNYARSIYKPQNKIGKVIRDFYVMDKVFYQDNSVGNAIQNYLDLAKRI